ncbi:murein transglycosylase A [Engelhardtia mirabilis]|uniref:peptidoglycan lytic exotransglycosylase n=1 Tax=Engelhardtia mirabilis TaxID=2528011 RepID=A0A518BDI2_9BACT|nr:Membrane-bound lytic murein transglycosylase A precursor [Planctomycetes bacterium Pla133]QDU99338.1 Membrane-bound lytic murein transglycosylase A precursor [Planctomycetes bacterium Pla86]
MRRLVPLLLACALTAVGCRSADYDRPLPEGAAALIPLPAGWDSPDVAESWQRRAELAPALERSITWLRRPHTQRFFPQAGMTHERVLASCVRLAELLEDSSDGEEFQRAFDQEFEVFVSAGWNGRGGGVLFTAYYTPVFEGSLTESDAYHWPLYAKPDDLVTDADGRVLGIASLEGKPYPSRRAIEKYHLLENRDLELVWLRDPLDAYLCHVQGSAVISLPDGEELRLGFGGTNGREYTSLAAALVEDKQLDAGARGIPAIRAWASANPERVEEYLHRNERYTFFTPIDGRPHGSLDFPVEPLASLATDKTVFPRGAPVFVDADLSTGVGASTRPLNAILLDQDTGGGIRTAGRADIYVGVGDEAGSVAGRTASEGQLYYLMLREDLVPLYSR